MKSDSCTYLCTVIGIQLYKTILQHNLLVEELRQFYYLIILRSCNFTKGQRFLKTSVQMVCEYFIMLLSLNKYFFFNVKNFINIFNSRQSY